MNRKLKPWLAALLSFFLPGLGLAYCREFRDSIIAFAGWIIVGNIAVAILLYADLGFINVIIPLALMLTYYIGIIAYSYLRAARIREVPISTKYAIFGKWYSYIILIIIFVVLMPYLIPVWAEVKGFSMTADSMANTFHPGDWILADLSAYHNDEPVPQDLVIFLWPGDSETVYIKRCVAKGDQKVEIIDKKLFVDGVAFADTGYAVYSDSTVRPRPAAGENSRDNWGPYFIPKDSYFMMGDNRDNSYDSRFWGPVDKGLILGKAIRIYWSDDFGRIGMAAK
jgi:signal peptidase I